MRFFRPTSRSRHTTFQPRQKASTRIVVFACICLATCSFADSLPPGAEGVVVFKKRPWSSAYEVEAVPFVSISPYTAFFRVELVSGKKMEIMKGLQPTILYSSSAPVSDADGQIAALEQAKATYPTLNPLFNEMLEGWNRLKARTAQIAKEMPVAKPSIRDFLMADGTKTTGTISSVDPDGIKIITDSGVQKIPFEKFAAAVQEEFGFNPEKAIAFKAGLDRSSSDRKNESKSQSPADQVAVSGPSGSQSKAVEAEHSNEQTGAIRDRLPLKLESGKFYIIELVQIIQLMDDGLLVNILPDNPGTRSLVKTMESRPGDSDLQRAVEEELTAMPGYDQNEIQERVLLIPSNLKAYRGTLLREGQILEAEGTYQENVTLQSVIGGSFRVPVFRLTKLILKGSNQVVDLR